MARRRSPKDIKKDIMNYFEKQSFPRTTGQVAKAVKLNWHSANYYLTLLKGDGKLFHEKVGRQNQWWPENIDRLTKENRELRRRVRELEEKVKVLEKK